MCLLGCFAQEVDTFVPSLQENIIAVKVFIEVLLEYIPMNRCIVQGDCKILRANLLKDALENSFSDCKDRVGLHVNLSLVVEEDLILAQRIDQSSCIFTTIQSSSQARIDLYLSI